MRVVVMGCGRVGSSLADGLSRIGHDVAVIDRDSTAFNRLSPEFAGERVLGQGFDRDVLLRAGIEEADAFAAVSSGDNSNIISARLARETFGVQRVVARIYDAKRAEVYERLGIPTIATVPWTTDRLLNVLTRESETAKWRDPTGTVAVAEVDLARGLGRAPGHRPGAGHRRAGGVHDPVRHRHIAGTQDRHPGRRSGLRRRDIRPRRRGGGHRRAATQRGPRFGTTMTRARLRSGE